MLPNNPLIPTIPRELEYRMAGRFYRYLLTTLDIFVIKTKSLEDRIRERALVLLIIAISLICPAMLVVMNYGAWDYPALNTLLVLALVACVIALVRMVSGQSTKSDASVMLSIVWMNISIFTVLGGGIYSPAILFFATAFLVCTEFLDYRTGRLGLILCLVSLLASVIIGMLGIDLIHAPDSWSDSDSFLFILGLNIALMLTLGQLNQMHRESFSLQHELRNALNPDTFCIERERLTEFIKVVSAYGGWQAIAIRPNPMQARDPELYRKIIDQVIKHCDHRCLFFSDNARNRIILAAFGIDETAAEHLSSLVDRILKSNDLGFSYRLQSADHFFIPPAIPESGSLTVPNAPVVRASRTGSPESDLPPSSLAS